MWAIGVKGVWVIRETKVGPETLLLLNRSQPGQNQEANIVQYRHQGKCLVPSRLFLKLVKARQLDAIESRQGHYKFQLISALRWPNKWTEPGQKSRHPFSYLKRSSRLPSHPMAAVAIRSFKTMTEGDPETETTRRRSLTAETAPSGPPAGGGSSASQPIGSLSLNDTILTLDRSPSSAKPSTFDRPPFFDD